MYVPGIADKLPKGTPVGIVGIESHICVLQTTIDLLNGEFHSFNYLAVRLLV